MSSEKPATAAETEVAEGAPSVPPKNDIPATEESGSKSPAAAVAPSDAPLSQEENPPPKPPRPANKVEEQVKTLKEAFPGTDENVIKAILQASGGNIETAFNALLGMSDPSYVAEEQPPPRPPRPVASDGQTSTPLTQLEADELYARQLAEHYSGRGGGGGGGAPRRVATGPPRSQRQEQYRREEEEREHSFLDDDLPVIKENIRKGFLETQSKVNKWVSDFKKKLDGEESDDPADHGGTAAGRASNPGHMSSQQQQQQQQQHQFPPRGASRRSGDAYDADPRVIDEDFSHLELKDNTGDTQQRPSRPIANPNLFSSGNQQQPTSGRKVSFQEQTDDDLYRPPPPNRPSSGGGNGMPPSALRQPSPTPGSGGAGAAAAGGATNPSSKWAPLEAVEPTPLSNDPFSLGDSDDEGHETAPGGGKTGPQETGVTAAAKEEKK